MKYFVFAVLLVFSSVSFSGGHGHNKGHDRDYGHNKGHDRKKMNHKRHHNSGFVSRGRVYRPVYHAPRVVYHRPIVYSIPSYTSYQYDYGFGYEGALGASIGQSIGGLIYYNKYVR